MPDALTNGSMATVIPRPTREQGATFGSRLRYLREARGLGQNKLAVKAGLGGLSRYERDERGKNPGSRVTIALAKALRASRDWLETGATGDGHIFEEDKEETFQELVNQVAERLGLPERANDGEEDAPPESSRGKRRRKNKRDGHTR